MANKKSTDRSKLVSGCGTILKSKRLKHGYTLVTRKRGVKTTTSATAPTKRKAGRPKKMTTVMSVTAPMKRKAGRPRKMTETITEKIVMSTPMIKAGSPAKSKSVMMKASSKLKPFERKKRRATVKA
jgi:hypothetical protein